MSEPTVSDLLARVNQNVGVYNDFLGKAGLPQPSHRNLPPPPTGPPPPLPDEVANALEAAKEATYELYQLLLGPMGLILETPTASNKIVALAFINRFQIAQKIVPGQKKSFQDLAQECGMEENELRHLLRLAMTEHLFVEPEEGFVAHSAASMMLLVVPNLDAWVWNMARLNFKAAALIPDAIAKWPGSEEPHESAFTMAHHLDKDYFDYLNEQPAEAERFSKSMAFITSSPPISVHHFIEAYDFSKLPANGVFVDVGGSHGIVAIEVAKAHPSLHCIVQDISEPALASGRESLPQELQRRVEFNVHDFWKPQPVTGADVYHFRWIFHDWSDLYSVKLLQSLVPVLKKGSRVIVTDICLPAHGTASPYQERLVRSIDCIMKGFQNAKERDEDEWRILFAKTDPRFRLQPVIRPPKAAYAIIEAIWDP